MVSPGLAARAHGTWMTSLEAHTQNNTSTVKHKVDGLSTTANRWVDTQPGNDRHFKSRQTEVRELSAQRLSCMLGFALD